MALLHEEVSARTRMKNNKLTVGAEREKETGKWARSTSNLISKENILRSKSEN